MPVTPHGPQAGHGVVMSLELDPVGAPGVFTRLANITSGIDLPKHDRREAEITAHDNTIDDWMLSVPMRDVLTVTAAFCFDNPSHDHVTGAIKLYYWGGTFGVKFDGPAYPNGDSSGFYMASGQLKTYQIKQPNLQGERQLDLTFRFRGPEIISAPATGAVRYGT